MPRIGGLEIDQVEDDLRAVYESQEQFYGAALYNHKVLARRPPVFRGFRAMWKALEEGALLPARLRDLVNLKVASLIGCGL
jgi:alkylhydroperoxidase family enzyme